MNEPSDPSPLDPVRLVPFGLPELAPPHASAAVLTELHIELLPTSPLVKAGTHFLRDFYYRVLPEEQLILGFVAYLDDQPIGFLVGTRDANNFMTVALRRRWRSLGATVLRHPPWPGALIMGAQIGKDRQRQRTEMVSEFLSLGVRATGHRDQGRGPSRRALARVLIDATRQHLPVPIIALLDETNVPAKRMYEDIGWRVSGTATAGWPIPQVVYRWDG